MIINKNVIFILCLLFCSKALSYGGLVRNLVESIQTGSQRIHNFFGRSAEHSDEVIDEEFYRTLDEILEMKGMNREDIHKFALDELRGAATDPLKLLYSDRYVHPNRYPQFFDRDFSNRTFDIENHHMFALYPENRDLFRAFLQRRLDINNEQQMKRLRRLVNKIAKKHNLSPYRVLYLLCRHDGFKNSDFIWFEDLYSIVMRGKSAKKSDDQKKKALQNMAQSCFKTEHSDNYRPVVVEFDKDMFFSYWKGQAFRDYIIDFNFISRYHLVDTDLLLNWADELKRKTGSLGQLPDFIRFSFEDAPVDYGDIGKAMSENPFLRTVLKATNEDSNFAREVEHILRSIVPKEGEPSLWNSIHPLGL